MAKVITQNLTAVRDSTNPRLDPPRGLPQPPSIPNISRSPRPGGNMGSGALDHPGPADMIQVNPQPPF